MNQLEVKNLSKRYKQNKEDSLSRFSYTFTEGIYGLLGPNGSGKSTLNNMIVGNLKPTSGEIRYNGEDIFRLGTNYREILGFVPQHQNLNGYFTVEKFLFYFAALKSMNKKTASKKIEELLHTLNLWDVKNKRVNALSGGMKQRLLITQALLNDPKILIMDEPTVGLDLRERIKLRNFIHEIARNKIVILSTHIMSDVELIGREFLLLEKGKLTLSGTLEQVMEAEKDMVWQLEIDEEDYSTFEEKYPRNRIVGEKDKRIILRAYGKEREKESQPVENMSLEDVYLGYF